MDQNNYSFFSDYFNVINPAFFHKTWKHIPPPSSESGNWSHWWDADGDRKCPDGDEKIGIRYVALVLIGTLWKPIFQHLIFFQAFFPNFFPKRWQLWGFTTVLDGHSLPSHRSPRFGTGFFRVGTGGRPSELGMELRAPESRETGSSGEVAF